MFLYHLVRLLTIKKQIKMKNYTVKGQNVYATFTLHGRQSHELFCIATTQDNAIEIATALNTIIKFTSKPESNG